MYSGASRRRGSTTPLLHSLRDFVVPLASRLRCSTRFATSLLHSLRDFVAPLASRLRCSTRFARSTTPLFHSLRSLHDFVAPPRDIVTGLRYIGLVVIVNAVVSKLAFGAVPTLLTPPFPAAPIIPTVPEDTLNAV